MTCVVVKFGGTSVGSIDRIKAAALIILDLQNQGHSVVVVVSAMSGETNALVDLMSSFETSDPEAYDTLVSTGEQVTTALMSLALQDLGARSKTLQGWQVPIVTTDHFSKARIDAIPTQKLDALLAQGIIPIIPGFQGVTKEGDITTFGRGGSDVTAVVIAAALKADFCYLYKDVPGILSADPSLVEDPQVLDRLSIEEMFEMSSQGAQVVHPRAIEAAFVHDIDLKILPIVGGGEGTQITAKPLEAQTITGIVCNKGEVRIVLQEMPVSPGVTACLFEVFATASISLDMILQGGAVTQGAQTQDLTFTVPESDEKEAVSLLKKLQKKIGFARMDVHPRIAKVSIVGAGLRGHASVAHTLHQTVADLGISLYGFTTTELKMSVLVSDEYAPQLVRKLHDNFKLTQQKEEKYATESTRRA